MTVWDDIAATLEERTATVAREASPPVRRGKVVRANPLLVELAEDHVLEEGDDDVELDEAVKTTRPAVGDIVRVHTAEDGDYIISGTIKGG